MRLEEGGYAGRGRWQRIAYALPACLPRPPALFPERSQDQHPAACRGCGMRVCVLPWTVTKTRPWEAREETTAAKTKKDKKAQPPQKKKPWGENLNKSDTQTPTGENAQRKAAFVVVIFQ